jgi:SOS-response transcriptional repressor LexA
MPSRTQSVSIPGIGSKVRDLRERLGLGQIAFAQALGIDQAAIARWEKDTRPLPVRMVLKIAEIAPEDERAWWLGRAGVKAQTVATDEKDIRHIPLLRDAAAAGTPRAINEKEIESVLAFPRELLPRGGKLTAIRISGDSMAPILNEGYIVMIDELENDIHNLVERMVAARDAEGVTIKWLRKSGKHYVLVPQHITPRHQVYVIDRESNFDIVGAVVKWIGEPPRPRK